MIGCKSYRSRLYAEEFLLKRVGSVRIKSMTLIGLLACLSVALPAAAQNTGSNVTGRKGVIAIDKVGNKIRFLDPVSLTEVTTLEPPEKGVHELAISYDHKTAYVPLYGDGIYGANKTPNNKVLIVDLVQHQIAGVIELGQYIAPHGLLATRDGKLWVTCDIPNKLLYIDPAARKIEAVYDIPGKGAHFITLLPDESRLFASNKEAAAQVFDTVKRSFVAAIPAMKDAQGTGNGSGYEGLTPTPDGRHLLIVDNDKSELHVIDTKTSKEVDRIPLQGAALTSIKRTRLVKLMFSPDGRTLVATSYGAGQAWVIDARDYRKQKLLAVAKGPQGVAFDPDGKTVIVSSHDSGLLTRVDLATGKPMRSYDGGDGIEALAFY
jgi:DNA-binding beta-propeller fold protein YncE